MRAFLALLRREYLEHRGAFFYAPLVLLGLFVLFVAMVLLSHHVDFAFYVAGASGQPVKLYDFAYFGAGALWWLYLAMMLFFYYADAYHADTRNNAMLFWKSMPVGDYPILLSKFVAGLTVFPALIFAALLVCGLILAVAALALPLVVPGAPAPNPGAVATAFAEDSAAFFVYLVLALLWYAPFFAWVGALSTVVGRWSVPLALLLPVGASVFEGVVNFGTAPGGSYLLTYLRERVSFEHQTDVFYAAILSPLPLNTGTLAERLIAAIDWPQVAGGLLFAVAVLYLAARYRQRVIKG